MGQKNPALSLVRSARRVRVIVADPYPVILYGVRKMMEEDPRFQVVAEASTMPSFLKKVLAERPDAALLDWRMASQDREATTELLQSDLHSAAIIFLTVSENSPEKREMLRLGARAFVSKWCSASKLRTAVSKFCTGSVFFETAETELGASNSPGPSPEQRIKQLTHRERQLLPLVCSGLKNREIALRLGISESTVWHHLTAVFAKLQVGDRLGLAAFAYGHRLVLPGPQPRPSLRAVESHPSPSLGYPPTADFDPQLTEEAQS
jgi:two-component system, NarL family, nitrate/nitrite response regulator NarL